jgi:hypothetical protein
MSLGIQVVLFGETVNLVAVIAAAVVSFVLGVIWYAPPLLGRYWIEEDKLANSAQAGVAKTLGSAAVSSFLIAFVLEVILVGLNLSTWVSVFELAALVWIGFYFTKEFASMMSGDKPMKVFASIALHDAIMLLLMVSVLFALK